MAGRQGTVTLPTRKTWSPQVTGLQVTGLGLFPEMHRLLIKDVSLEKASWDGKENAAEADTKLTSAFYLLNILGDRNPDVPRLAVPGKAGSPEQQSPSPPYSRRLPPPSPSHWWHHRSSSARMGASGSQALPLPFDCLFCWFFTWNDSHVRSALSIPFLRYIMT